MDSRMSSQLIARWYVVSVVALSSCAKVDSRLAAEISEYLQSKDRAQFAPDVERKVEEWGEGCVPILIKMLKTSRVVAPDTTAFYLGKTRDPSAVQPLIKYVEKCVAKGSDVYYGCLALGWIGDDKAIEYLARLATDPRCYEHAINGLAEAGNRKALATLKGLEKTLATDRPKKLYSAIERCEETAERNEGFQRARNITNRDQTRLREFWNLQTARPSSNPAEEIIGEYEGTAFWTNYFENFQTRGVRIIFREDGVFETNFALLNTMEKLPFREAELHFGEVTKGQYRVLGPTQLVLGSGDGVSTYGLSLDNGRLSFFHERLRAFFSLGKNPGASPPFTPSDIAGAYKGFMYGVAEGVPGRCQRVDDVEIVFSDNGFFGTNFHDRYGNHMLGLNTLKSEFLIDQYGKLVCYYKYGVGTLGADAARFFDWHFREGALYVNLFSTTLVLSPSNDVPKLQTEDLLNNLTDGIYVGSAFRTTPEGLIREFPGIELQFSKDGTYRGNFQVLRKPDQQHQPLDEGLFVLISDRHLYMVDKWKDRGLTNQGISDVLLQGDQLNFTSFWRKAYFTLRKKAA